MRYSLYFKSRRKYEVYSKNKDIFCVHLRILDVIIDKTLFLSMKTRKLSSSGISLPLFLAFISSWRKPENILKYCLRRSCFSGLPALRIIPSKVNLNFSANVCFSSDIYFFDLYSIFIKHLLLVLLIFLFFLYKSINLNIYII